MNLQNFIIFLAHWPYIQQQNNEIMTLLLYVNFCLPEGATKLGTFSVLQQFNLLCTLNYFHFKIMYYYYYY